MKPILQELNNNIKDIISYPIKEYCCYMLGLIDLPKWKQEIAEQLTAIYRKEETIAYQAIITLCKGTGCLSSGEQSLWEKFSLVLQEKGMSNQVLLVETGCRGFCEMGPILEIFPHEIFYKQVEPSHVEMIIEKTILRREIIKDLVFQNTPFAYEMNFYRKQTRKVLEKCGLIDAENINDAIATGAYAGLSKVLNGMQPEEVISEITKSGLRGRGGGGFPTGKKWNLTKGNVGKNKFSSKHLNNEINSYNYALQNNFPSPFSADANSLNDPLDPVAYIICNADEGDPGAFMDRSILEGEPHKVIEGMIICAYATGATKGFIYVRAEYPLAIHRLEIAISQATAVGLLGNNIMGKDFSFSIQIAKGAGAFVCGEETALLASIEGRRGMPRLRPPFPAEAGLMSKPTTINNVETFASVPIILHHGWQQYASLGTETSKGTKIFALTGKINNTGLVEVPMGITLREIIYDIGGGIKDDQYFKAAQIGGPSGGCLTSEHLDLPLDFDSLQKVGAMVGSGGLVVLDNHNCMVEMATFFMSFTKEESCGKCTFCRIGTLRMLEILTKITEGKGKSTDLQKLEELALNISHSSLCALGKTAPNPVLTTLRYFRHEYEEHIDQQICSAGVCKALFSYYIHPHKCIGCKMCAHYCPVQCITGQAKALHLIDQNLCIKCGICIKRCKFKAIEIKGQSK